MQKDKGILPKISAIFLGITDVFFKDSNPTFSKNIAASI